MTGIRGWLRYAIAMIFPKRCACCGTLIPPQHSLCEACERSLPIVVPPICPYCAHAKADCSCHKRRHAYDRTAAAVYYEDAGQAGVLRLKRVEDPEAIALFAEWLTAVVRREYADETMDALVYVPMSKRAFREREFNQSERLASALAARIGLPMEHALVKLYDTPPQKRLGLQARTGNVLGVFDAVTDVRGKTLLLVDDVMTTGATLHECAKMLKLYGAKRVLAVTLAVRRIEKKTDGIV